VNIKCFEYRTYPKTDKFGIIEFDRIQSPNGENIVLNKLFMDKPIVMYAFDPRADSEVYCMDAHPLIRHCR
jgi:hypothetical protein